MNKSIKSRLVSLMLIVCIAVVYVVFTVTCLYEHNEEIANSNTYTEITSEESYDTVLNSEIGTNSKNDSIIIEYEEQDDNYIEYIVDVLSITDNVISGDTASIDEYSGKILVDISEISNSNEIETNETYYIKAETLIEIGNIPKLKAISIEKATDEQINELEANREKISNYAECKLNYESMNINDIIEDANENYVYWTQEEREEFINYINNLEKTEEVTSLLKIYTYKENVDINENTIVE